jgi:hypothetical protein
MQTADSHTSDGGTAGREGRTLLGTQAKPLHSQMAVSGKPFLIGHMFILTFLLIMTNTMISQNIDLSSWDTLYSVQYYPQFRVTAVGLGTYYPRIRGNYCTLFVGQMSKSKTHHQLQCCKGSLDLLQHNSDQDRQTDRE